MIQKNKTAMSRIIRMQVLSGLIGFFCLLVFTGWLEAASYLGGVMLMLMNAWWMGRRLDSAGLMDAESAQRSLLSGAALRFIALIAGLLLAQLVGLSLMLVAVGIFVAQVLVYVVALYGLKDI